eukprot:CAMPEP_0116926838 /NCGR_PEP_ID=MMETSP0467-20121206/24976_1 /TAXON_ID=283647 /ORGANISM="Mesodinium pulex, Strain SPMC105" /LENGTH=38 /DNA_ID= /DNA_START= /DNA_END= /DNA_ORIENTATION=
MQNDAHQLEDELIDEVNRINSKFDSLKKELEEETKKED